MKKNKVFKTNNPALAHLQHKMQQYYLLFQLGLMNEKEYLSAIKPLDTAIDAMEMSTLKEYLVLKESSLKHFHVREK